MDNWQIECCVPPPGVGDLVSWPLLWVDDPAGPGALRLAWHGEPLRAAAWVDAGDALLRHGPLTAFWRGPAAAPAHGRLVADTHGGVPEQVPPVGARVLAVEVIEQAYRLVPPRTYVAIPGDFVLRRVERSPRWFSDEDDVSLDDALPEADRQLSGVLVRLALGGA